MNTNYLVEKAKIYFVFFSISIEVWFAKGLIF